MSDDRVRYTARDFDTLVDDLLFRLKEKYGDTYNDFAATSTGMMLVDLIAFALDQLSFYEDRRAAEAFLATARHRTSVSKLTRQIGYRMSPAASATKSLTVSPTTAIPFEVTLPAGFKFSGPGGLVFEASQNTVWAANDVTPTAVPVTEGASKRVSGTSDGSKNQEIRLPAAGDPKYLIDGTVRVFVDGEEWTENDFLTLTNTKQFEVHHHEEPPLVRFGDGVAGAIPPSGAEIRILFRAGSGELGNAASGTVTSVAQPLVARGQVVALTILDLAAATGGSAPETIESARKNAPGYFASRQVAVTKEDYGFLTRSFSSAQYGTPAQASAFVARTSDEDATSKDLIDSAKLAESTYTASMAASLAAITASASAASVDIAAADAAGDNITTKAAAITSSANTALEAAFGVLGSRLSVIEGAAVFQKLLTDPDGELTYDIDELIALSGMPAGAVTDLTNNWKPAIETAKALMDATANALNTHGTSAKDEAQSIIQDAAEVTTHAATVVSTAAGAEVDQASIRAAVVTANANGALLSPALVADLDDILTHISSVLVADCKSNLINVPVLALDGDGFYAAPSVGLRRELETYLAARSDVAHQVKVVSGASSLVPATITVTLKVLDAYVYAEVASEVSAVLRELLKAREFGLDLRKSTVFDSIQGVTGVDVFDVTVSAEAEYLDSSQNVIVDKSHVVTLGSLVMAAG